LRQVAVEGAVTALDNKGAAYGAPMKHEELLYSTGNGQV
jgi:hypothetical protein